MNFVSVRTQGLLTATAVLLWSGETKAFPLSPRKPRSRSIDSLEAIPCIGPD